MKTITLILFSCWQLQGICQHLLPQEERNYKTSVELFVEEWQQYKKEPLYDSVEMRKCIFLWDGLEWNDSTKRLIHTKKTRLCDCPTSSYWFCDGCILIKDTIIYKHITRQQTMEGFMDWLVKKYR